MVLFFDMLFSVNLHLILQKNRSQSPSSCPPVPSLRLTGEEDGVSVPMRCCHGEWVRVYVLVPFGVLHISEAAKIIFMACST